MNLSESAEIRNKEYRHGLINAQIEVDLPLQIRALRKQLVGTQPDLANLTGMKQSRISDMEKPGKVHFSLETLRRLAEAFDVALIVRFAPFSEFLDWSDRFSSDAFRVPSFPEELQSSAAPEESEKAPIETQCAPSLAGDDLSWLGNSFDAANKAIAAYSTQRRSPAEWETRLNLAIKIIDWGRLSDTTSFGPWFQNPPMPFANPSVSLQEEALPFAESANEAFRQAVSPDAPVTGRIIEFPKDIADYQAKRSRKKKRGIYGRRAQRAS
jgi:transcriptional regulator with XRE-family HTH domain